MKNFIYIHIVIGIIITSTTDLLDGMINVEGVFISPDRIYMTLTFFLAIILFLNSYSIVVSTDIKKIIMSLIMFLIVVFISIWQSPYFEYSLKKFLFTATFFLFPIGIFFILTSSKLESKVIVAAFFRIAIIIGLMLALFGITQEFSEALLKEYEYRDVFSISILRVTSLFYDANFFGYYLLIPLFLNSKEIIKLKIFRYIIFLTVIIAVFLTGSQGTVLAILVGYFFIIFRENKLIEYVKYAVIFFLPIFIMYLVLDSYDELLLNAENLNFDTGVSRLLSWYSGLMLYQEHWLLGLGPGNFVTRGKGVFLVGIIPDYKINSIDQLAAHSTYIEVITESGVFALILYLSFFIFIIKFLDKKAINNPFLYRVSALLVASMFANMLLSYYSVILFLIIGISLYLAEKNIVLRSL